MMAVDRISNVMTTKSQDCLVSLVENRKEDSDTAQKIVKLISVKPQGQFYLSSPSMLKPTVQSSSEVDSAQKSDKAYPASAFSEY